MLRGAAGLLVVLSVRVAAAGEVAVAPPVAERVAFTPNVGQYAEDVDFAAATQGMAVAIGRQGLAFTVADEPPSKSGLAGRITPRQATFSMRLVGASMEARGAAVDELPGVDHFYTGADP